ncbi:MAG: type I 3-dehydroquinate dehydratase [Planctomycetes bacterium]|jgi:hypothetical protein|nr:type I 3-dehydroquinate dehydratase [Planctomycetota bacterium]
MTPKFTDLPRPLLVGSLRHRTTARTIADIKACQEDGARAFILHIQRLDDECRKAAELSKIFAATRHPVMAINYRVPDGPSDEDRLTKLLEAARAGAACIDLPGDIFDADSRGSLKNCPLPFGAANPEEISMRPKCIEKQKLAIEQAHALGAQVLMSTHCLGAALDCSQAVALAIEIESRGADIVKIVTACPSVDHALEMLRTMVELKRTLRVPFVYICTGPHGQLIRPLAPLLGSMLVFGHHEYDENSNMAKPLLSDLREFYRIMQWRVDDHIG